MSVFLIRLNITSPGLPIGLQILSKHRIKELNTIKLMKKLFSDFSGSWWYCYQGYVVVPGAWEDFLRLHFSWQNMIFLLAMYFGIYLGAFEGERKDKILVPEERERSDLAGTKHAK